MRMVYIFDLLGPDSKVQQGGFCGTPDRLFCAPGAPDAQRGKIRRGGRELVRKKCPLQSAAWRSGLPGLQLSHVLRPASGASNHSGPTRVAVGCPRMHSTF